MIDSVVAKTRRFRTSSSGSLQAARTPRHAQFAFRSCQRAGWGQFPAVRLRVKTSFMPFSPSIFKAYDIRGLVPSTLNAEVAHQLGLAFAAAARREGEQVVAVGRDGRDSGPDLAAALAQGLLAGGVDVVNIGMVTTPMTYFAASSTVLPGCRSGIQVTGSHNPRDYNGFKMVLAGRAIHGDEIQALRHAMDTGVAPSATPGARRDADVSQAYVQRILGDVTLATPIKLVVDSGNGVAGAHNPAVLKALGCEVKELYSEVDGSFPNHHPDPSKPENLRDVQRVLCETDAELGLAFDGDGDRLGVVTKDGQIIYPDRQLILLARDVLSRHPGATILYDVKCTQAMAPAIRAAGGVPQMCRTGHSLVKAELKRTGAPLAGEMSGHIFFAERWFGFDDALYVAARLLQVLAREKALGRSPSEVLNALPSAVSTPELNVPCAEGEPHRVVAELVARARFEGAEVATIDGLRVDWPDGFGLIRASNTTPVLVLRFEGQTIEVVARIEQQMLALLRQVKPDAQVQHAAH